MDIGSKKTFLWHTTINRIRSEGLLVLVVASSGVASLLLPGGRTTHSRFKIFTRSFLSSQGEQKKILQMLL
jgi:hypothetical protein